jgi:hypothetical protein
MFAHTRITLTYRFEAQECLWTTMNEGGRSVALLVRLSACHRPVRQRFREHLELETRTLNFELYPTEPSAFLENL